MDPQFYGRPVATVLIDDRSEIGESISGLVVHRQACKICGTTGTNGVNRRLCVVGERFLSRLCAAWVAQGHHHSYAWMVSNAV